MHERSKEFECHICEYKTATPDGLKKHVQAKHEGRVYPCKHCDKKFSFQANLIRHEKRVHEGKQPVKYKCGICDASMERGALKKHIKAIHNAERPHHCDECDYKCFNRHQLNSHKATHRKPKKEK